MKIAVVIVVLLAITLWVLLQGCWCGGGFSECECKPGTCAGTKCGKGCLCTKDSKCRGAERSNR